MADENIDRGDTLPADDDKLPPSTIDDTQSAEAADAEKLAEEAAARGDEGEGEAEEQPRDSKGKFTKKEAPDHVPKSRFDEAVNKERAAREAAERRAAELEAKVKQEEKSVEIEKMEADVEKLEQQHAKLLLDGEAEKAAAVMKQIRQAERQIARIESDEKTSRATAQAVEQVRMEAAIAKLEADYPEFNPDSESYDQDLTDLVLAEQARLIQTQSMMPSKALTSAAAKIMSKLQKPAAADKEGAKGLAAAKGGDRKAEQVAKNLDTAKKQPASMKASGKDSDQAGEGKIDVSALTAEEFKALPETTKARLRGDFL